MRAVKIFKQTAVNEIMLSEVDDPHPAPGEALIRLKAAALNHRDLYFFDTPIDTPIILGSDGSGIVEAVGDGVETWQSSDEVVIYPSLDWGEGEDAFSSDFTILGGPRDGTLAEMIAIPAGNIYRKPKVLSFEESATLSLAGLTAYRALISRAHLKAGEHVLIHGIGGGVALFAMQFAKAVGARVMVTSRHSTKLDRAHTLGADLGINSGNQDWVQVARDWTDGRGVDLVVDSIGGDYLSKSLEALCLGGRLVTYGRTARTDTTIDVGLTFWNHLSIIGSTMGSPKDFAGMLQLVNDHSIKPVIDSIRPLSDVANAFERMAEGAQFGKLVLLCS
jgi:NADPH:quinone reductase-like Zn-dependent oxidoreductase